MKLLITLLTLSVLSSGARAEDFLIKISKEKQAKEVALIKSLGLAVEDLGGEWLKVTGSQRAMHSLSAMSLSADFVQKNYPMAIPQPWKSNDPKVLDIIDNIGDILNPSAVTDNPAIKPRPADSKGADPMLSKQWGMNDIGAADAWRRTTGNPNLIVAVIDTGVDYNHEDLAANMWRNNGETGMDASGRDKSNNGIDDDKNGYIDDVVGWDFVSNDNKPYDLYEPNPINLITKGGNPGHGTHCAGNVAARGNNAKGIAGVAPNVKIMALRFIGETGQGTTDNAIKAIRYAVDNGAKVLSNSWGGLGEDPKEAESNKALRDAIQYAQSKGALFVAAAGNGNQLGQGFDNDSSSTPAYPASYPYENIISVAALDSSDKLGTFSNWGRSSVDIGAPGVKVYSTVPSSAKYADTVLDLFGALTVTWDGTSMACPHVAGAAALYWSANPSKTWREVKDAILRSAKPIGALNGKVSSNGKLNMTSLLQMR